MSGLRDYWDGREPRERVLLSVLGVMVGLFVMVFALILPVLDARSDAAAALVRAQSDQARLARALPGASSNGAARRPFTRPVLLQSARAHDIQISRIQPSDDGRFAVWIDDAGSTEALYGMFEDLLVGTTATLDRAVVNGDANGRLSAQFTVGPN